MLKFLEPLKVIPENRLPFLYWILFTIIAGQSGIIIASIVGIYKDNQSLSNMLLLSYNNGDFYTYSIALLSSMIGLVFTDFITNNKQQFKQIKLNTVVIGAIILLFSSLTYPFLSKVKFEFTQLCVYFASIILSIYFYTLLKLDKSRLEFNNIKDIPYNEEDDENVRQITENSDKLNDDGSGNKI